MTKEDAKVASGETKSSVPMGPGAASQLAMPCRSPAKFNVALFSVRPKFGLRSMIRYFTLSMPADFIAL